MGLLDTPSLGDAQRDGVDVPVTISTMVTGIFFTQNWKKLRGHDSSL
jgi:hypothetical protein